MNGLWLSLTTWSFRSLRRGDPSCWSQSNIPWATNENCLYLFGIEMTPSGLIRLRHPIVYVKSSCLEQPSRFTTRDKVEKGHCESSQFCHLDNRDLKKKTCLLFHLFLAVLADNSAPWWKPIWAGQENLHLSQGGILKHLHPLVISSDYDSHVFSRSASKVKWPGCCCWNIHPIEVEQESQLHKTNMEKVLRVQSQPKWKLSFVYCLLQYNTNDSDGIPSYLLDSWALLHKNGTWSITKKK